MRQDILLENGFNITNIKAKQKWRSFAL